MKKYFFLSILYLSLFSVKAEENSYIVPTIHNYGDHLNILVSNDLYGPVICSGQIQIYHRVGVEHRYFMEEVEARSNASYVVIPQEPEWGISSFTHSIFCF